MTYNDYGSYTVFFYDIYDGWLCNAWLPIEYNSEDGYELNLYYDKENKIYFYSTVEYGECCGGRYASKLYVTKNGFASFVFGYEEMYWADNSDYTVYFDHIGDKFSLNWSNTSELGYAAAAFDFSDTMKQALDGYEIVNTINFNILFSGKATDGKIFIDKLSDEPKETDLPNSIPNSIIEASYDSYEFAAGILG